MKKFYYLLLLCTGMAFAAPPTIQNPVPFHVCDDNNDGFATFDLTSKNPEILGGNDSALYGIAYYETFVDANSDVNNIVSLNYTNITASNQVIFVRVWELANPSNFATTLLELVVDARPVAYPAPDLVVSESPFDGTAAFDLNVNESALSGGQTNILFMYFLTQADAETGANALPPGAFHNSVSPQTIWVSMTNMATGCYTIAHFNVAVIPTDVVYIPDPNFKAMLLSADVTNNIALGASLENVKIDINGDGEIQYSEALLAHYLDVHQAGIASLQGIEAFTNLVRLDCFSNSLTTLDVSALTQLDTLFCDHNQLTTLNIGGLTNLVMLFCDNNQLTSLDVTPNASLQNLQCGTNLLTSLQVSGLPVLHSLFCELNQLSTLDLTGLPGLQYLSCRDNHFTSLDFSDLGNLLELNCNSNQLSAIDVSASTQLTTLACGANAISALDVSMLPDLTALNCHDNQLTTLDLSNNTHLANLTIYANQLETLFVKNGSQENFDPADFIENPNLQYICGDDFQLASLQALAGASVSVNSYCTFVPGGDHNTIAGHVHYDLDGNGCDASDPEPLYVKVDISGPAANGSTFTNNSGFNFYTGAGAYVVVPDLENSYYFVSPFTVNFPLLDNSTQNVDLCLTPNGTHEDLEIVIAPIVPARPGFDAVYKIVYRNKGNQVMSSANPAFINFAFNSDQMTFVQADITPLTQTANLLGWDYTSLMPFESRSITVTMHVNAPTDANPVNVNDVLQLAAQINPVDTDETPGDNDFNFPQTVVGSFDPNALRCVEGDVVDPSEIGNYLHYLASFENTGTDVAENIVVRMPIDPAQFDVNSLRILDSSNPVDVTVTGNIAEYVFKNIQLAIGGHGNILLKLKTKTDLKSGDTVTSRAGIYFDYNLPVATNDANTTFQLLSVGDHDLDAAISVFPNPSHGLVNITASADIKSIQMYDAQGRILQVSPFDSRDASLDLSARQTGIYFLKITSDSGTKTVKIVKQ